MRYVFVTALLILMSTLAMGPRSSAAGAHFSGVYSSAMERVERDRRERIQKCAMLPGFESVSMTYVGKGGRRVECP